MFVGLCVCLWCLASTSDSTSESVVLWVCFVALENVAIRPEGISVTFLPVSLQPVPGNGVGRYPAAASRKRAQGVGRYPRSGDVSDRYMTVTRPLWAAC